jgi:hypothetical protein
MRRVLGEIIQAPERICRTVSGCAHEPFISDIALPIQCPLVVSAEILWLRLQIDHRNGAPCFQYAEGYGLAHASGCTGDNGRFIGEIKPDHAVHLFDRAGDLKGSRRPHEEGRR